MNDGATTRVVLVLVLLVLGVALDPLSSPASHTRNLLASFGLRSAAA